MVLFTLIQGPAFAGSIQSEEDLADRYAELLDDTYRYQVSTGFKFVNLYKRPTVPAGRANTPAAELERATLERLAKMVGTLDETDNAKASSFSLPQRSQVALSNQSPADFKNMRNVSVKQTPASQTVTEEDQAVDYSPVLNNLKKARIFTDLRNSITEKHFGEIRSTTIKTAALASVVSLAPLAAMPAEEPAVIKAGFAALGLYVAGVYSYYLKPVLKLKYFFQKNYNGLHTKGNALNGDLQNYPLSEKFWDRLNWNRTENKKMAAVEAIPSGSAARQDWLKYHTELIVSKQYMFLGELVFDLAKDLKAINRSMVDYSIDHVETVEYQRVSGEMTEFYDPMLRYFTRELAALNMSYSDMYHAPTAIEKKIEWVSKAESLLARIAKRYGALYATEETDGFLHESLPALKQVCAASLKSSISR